jgi:Ca2+-binding RTX toxin-like protein
VGRRPLAAALALVGLVAVAAPPAPASTARIADGKLRYTGGSEANRLTVTRSAGGFVIEDPGARISTRTGCRRETSRRAVCVLAGAISVSTGPGSDRVDLSAAEAPAVVGGGPGDDTLVGGPADDRLVGESGADSLDGGPGADVLRGGRDGGDTADYSARLGGVAVDLDGNADDGAGGEGDNVENDVERIRGTSAADRLTAISGNKSLIGGPGDDILLGSLGHDSLAGGEGDDQLSGGARGDELDGGPDIDLVDYRGSFDSVRVNLERGTGRQIRGTGPRRQFELDRLTAIENARGSRLSDSLVGDAGPNLLIGGPGHDVLDGGLGADVLDGGGGRDLADYRLRRRPVAVSLDGLAGDGREGEGDNVLPSVDGVLGGTRGDLLAGNDRANRLVGGGGPDAIFGAGGGDRVDGGDRADFLDGGSGADRLSGGGSRDALRAGPGGDRLLLRDGMVDDAHCGEGTDVAVADRRDRLEACERGSRR